MPPDDLLVTIIDRIDLSERRVTAQIDAVSQRVSRFELSVSSMESRLVLVERIVYSLAGLALTSIVIAVLRVVVR